MNNNMLHHIVRRFFLLGVVLIVSATETNAQEQNSSQTVSAPATNPPPPAGGGIALEKVVLPIESGEWKGSKLLDGQPNISGHWSNTIANHNNVTDPQGGIPNDPNPRRSETGPREQRAPSRVSDPIDGKLPLLPWAQAKVLEFQKGFHNPTKPEYVEPLARCAPAGIPKSLYWHGYEISQYPGYVLFQFNSGTRIIHLDKKPHLHENIKLWNGDSRGRWEGNTLVVDVRNQNGKALLGRSGEFISENAQIEERYIFNEDASRYNYVVKINDPDVYSQPFTLTIPAKRYTEKSQPHGWHFEVEPATHAGGDIRLDHYERICAENNGAFGLTAATK